MKKVCFLCPFNLNRLTGTPIRAKTVIRTAMTFTDVSVVTTREYSEATNVSKLDKATALPYTRLAFAHLRKNAPDIVHCITPLGLLAALPYALFRFGKTKVVFEVHGLTWFELKGTNLFRRVAFGLIDFFGLLFAHHIIAMSYSQTTFYKSFVSPQRLSVVWGPVDFDVAYSARIPQEKCIVGYLGNHAWWQGLPALIESARILSDRTDIHFNIGGFDASDDAQFPKLPNITYAGRVEHSNVVAFLRDCDVLASVRIKDTVSETQYPQKLSAYLASGRPVVASDVSDQRRIIESANCGIVIDERATPERIATALRTI